VRKVDYSAAPLLKAVAERARQIGNQLYPAVCALLADGDWNFPPQFDICLKRKLPHMRFGETRIVQVRLSAQYLEPLKDDPAALDQMLVHEMAHVAQHYYRPLLGRLLVLSPHPPSCWEEGIADYVCFKLGLTNGWACAECSSPFPHYRNGYSCAGAFLLYLDGTYNSNIVRQLNTALRQGRYSDAFFQQATGKELRALWAEFQQNPAFTPDAARMLELQHTLGFADGEAPKDLQRRLKRFLDEHADAPTRQMIRYASIPGHTAGDVQTRLAIVCYFTQPGGTAETYLVGLQEKHQLPGFAKGDHGTLTGVLRPRNLNVAFPAERSFTATKRGDLSTYHYTVVRLPRESSWKLQRAWRTGPDGLVAEEYRVP
jgi:hypothetical protein